MLEKLTNRFPARRWSASVAAGAGKPLTLTSARDRRYFYVPNYVHTISPLTAAKIVFVFFDFAYFTSQAQRA